MTDPESNPVSGVECVDERPPQIGSAGDGQVVVAGPIIVAAATLAFVVLLDTDRAP